MNTTVVYQLEQLSKDIQTLERLLPHLNIGSRRKRVYSLQDHIKGALRQLQAELKQCWQAMGSSLVDRTVLQRMTYDLEHLTARFDVCKDAIKNYSTPAEQPEPHQLDPRDQVDERSQLLQCGDTCLEYLIDMREQEIVVIEQDVSLVNDIFKRLSAMIVDQSQTVDHIESNMNVATIQVEGAVSELNEQNRRIRDQRSCCCWTLVLLVVACFILLVVIEVF